MKKLITGLLILATTAPNADKKVGTAVFHINHKNGDIVMEPVLAPTFKLSLMKGDGIESNSIVRCDIIAHTIEPDFRVTVIKCGYNEYGVSEVDFKSEVEK
jgi:hypothetical protein